MILRILFKETNEQTKQNQKTSQTQTRLVVSKVEGEGEGQIYSDDGN